MSGIEIVAFAIAATLAILVAAEFVARAMLRSSGGYYCWWPNRKQRFNLDRGSLPMLSPVVRWQVNRDGERGGVPPSKGRVVLSRVDRGRLLPGRAITWINPRRWPGSLSCI